MQVSNSDLGCDSLAICIVHVGLGTNTEQPNDGQSEEKTITYDSSLNANARKIQQWWTNFFNGKWIYDVIQDK